MAAAIASMLRPYIAALFAVGEGVEPVPVLVPVAVGTRLGMATEGSVAFWYELHVALGAKSQVESMQMDCRAGPWALMTTAGAAQRTSKRLVRALPTTVRSSLATPKEAAESATCVMK